jgi:hypothetical protein
MTAIQTKIEESRDIQKIVLQTITQQSIEDIEPNENARSYRKEQVDGVYTMVEEFLLNQGAPQYSVDGSVSSEPLESHKLFKDVGTLTKANWATWKRNPSADSLAKANSGSVGPFWTPQTDGVLDEYFAIFWVLYSAGIESYYAPRITIRMTLLMDGAPDMTNLGTIDTNGWPGAGISKPAGMNFILSSCHAQQEGDQWRTTYEYLGSNPASGEGWNGPIYAGG